MAVGSLSLGNPGLNHGHGHHHDGGQPDDQGNPSHGPGWPNGQGQGGPNNHPVEQQPANTDGSYLTYVGGYYTGQGTSTVAGNVVSIQATVSTADGSKGILLAPALVLKGDHFGGLGTANGTVLTLVGRIDGYDKDNHFKGARVLLHYSDANGHYGKIAGVIVP